MHAKNALCAAQVVASHEHTFMDDEQKAVIFFHFVLLNALLNARTVQHIFYCCLYNTFSAHIHALSQNVYLLFSVTKGYLKIYNAKFFTAHYKARLVFDPGILNPKF